MFRNTYSQYGSISKFFHWLISLLILGMLISGFIMVDIQEKSLKFQVIDIHKSFGLTILVLMILRALWALINPKPKSMPGLPLWEKAAEHTSHFILYLLAFGAPISGWVLSMTAGYVPKYFGLFEVPIPGIGLNKPLAEQVETFHELFAWGIIVIVSIHILAALKHHFWNKDTVLKRMLPGKRM